MWPTKEARNKYKREWARRWRRKNPELARGKVQAYRNKHRDHLNKIARLRRNQIDPATRRVTNRKHYLNRREQRLKYGRQYRKKNAIKIQARNRQYKKLDFVRFRAAQRARERRRENPEHFREIVRLRRLKNPEHFRRRARKYYHANKQRVMELAKKRYQRDMLDPVLLEKHRQQARERASSLGEKIRRKAADEKRRWIVRQLMQMARDDGFYKLLAEEYENGERSLRQIDAGIKKSARVRSQLSNSQERIMGTS